MRYNLYDEKLVDLIECGRVRVMSYKTKRARDIVEQYDRIPPRGGWTINGCYINPSPAKERAYWDCVNLRIELGGESGTILRANSFVFSYAFAVRRENGTRWIVFVTPSHKYAIDIWQEEEAEFMEWLEERDKAELEGMEDFDELLEDEG